MQLVRVSRTKTDVVALGKILLKVDVITRTYYPALLSIFRRIVLQLDRDLSTQLYGPVERLLTFNILAIARLRKTYESDL